MEKKILIRNEFVERLQWRIRNNYDCFIPIVGKRGIGKSNLMIWLMRYCDPCFSIDNVVWEPIETYKKIATAPEGTAIGIDEIGNLWNNRRHAEEMNKIFNETTQSSRFKKHYVFVTCPSLRDLDVGGRNMADHFIEVRQRGFGVVFENWINLKTGDRGQHTWGNIKFPALPEEIEDLYIAKKVSIENRRYEERLKKVEAMREKEIGDTPFVRVLKKIKEDPEQFMRNGKIDAQYLAAKIGVSNDTAYKVKRVVERDGLLNISIPGYQ